MAQLEMLCKCLCYSQVHRMINCRIISRRDFFARHCYGYYNILQSMTRNSFRSHKSTTTGLFSFSSSMCNMRSYVLTLRRFREVRGEECGITVSLVGMDPDINPFFNWINSPFSRGTAMGLCSKQLSSK